MITIRKAAERGHADHGWLETYHTFSFADYRDPAHMGFRSLRVINEDVVQPGRGFGRHPHNDMEIVTYVLSGALKHEDSLGNGSVIRPGEVQYMCAGTGVLHSEVNPSSAEPVHLLQIWIRPDRTGHEPDYAQRDFPLQDRLNSLCPVISPDGRLDSIAIHQDVVLYATMLEPGASVSHELLPRRHAWLQVARGDVVLGELALSAGDGAAIRDEAALRITAAGEAEILLFDLA